MRIVENVDAWKHDRSDQACALWAKSGREDAYLTLVQHLADAVSVAEWLWEHWVSDALKATLSRLWQLSEDEVRALYCFLAGTHDVGKATVSFQRLVEHRPDSRYLLAPLEDAGLPLEWPQGEGAKVKFPHGVASALLLNDWLRRFDLDKQRRFAVASVLDAHHGFASDPLLMKNRKEGIHGRQSVFDTIAVELFDSMAELTGVEDALQAISWGELPAADALQLTTGLVIMADWIASSEEAFPYDLIKPQPERLEDAMAAVDLPKPWSPVAIAEQDQELFQTTFAWSEEYQPRPVQAAAVQTARMAQGPTLMIVEAPTGEGKTEAALAAAHVFGASNGAQGVFLAAPTMATANGLFERATEWAQRSSRGGEVASMYLAHSKNRLSQRFRALRYSSISEDERANAARLHASSGAVVATQWLSGRNKGILSDFVVGTVDQVLMMALQTRFSMLRHVGLAGKVVIIDEVHAYDAYMSQYLKRTLEWLARYRVNVILMSATLPPAQRKALAQAYASQLIYEPEQAVQALETPDYPLISVVDGSGVRAVPVPSRPTDAVIAVARLDDSIDSLTHTLSEHLAEGGIALVIANTIARAQAAFRALEVQFPGEVELHHAAFLAAHRSDKEDALRAQLGPSAHRGQGRPWRRIIVATQVAEQSLDIDADLLITDIAPIDLIIQRAGRLHRHQRPVEDRPTLLQQPQMFLRGIVSDGADNGTAPDFDGGAKAVYGEALLLATLAHLPNLLRRPDDVASLVRVVYADDVQVPDRWKPQMERARTDALNKRALAERRATTFQVPSPSYASDLPQLFTNMHDNHAGVGVEERGLAQVRDAEFTIEVIAIRDTEYGYALLDGSCEVLDGVEPSYSVASRFAEHSVRLPARMLRRDSDFDAVIGALERQTPPEWTASSMLRGQVALRLDADGRAELGRFAVSYDNACGLSVMELDS